ncbi:hypothetical protein AHAS_Ahas15G0350000 [Arachis hypogaea]
MAESSKFFCSNYQDSHQATQIQAEIHQENCPINYKLFQTNLECGGFFSYSGTCSHSG